MCRKAAAGEDHPPLGKTAVDGSEMAVTDEMAEMEEMAGTAEMGEMAATVAMGLLALRLLQALQFLAVLVLRVVATHQLDEFFPRR